MSTSTTTVTDPSAAGLQDLIARFGTSFDQDEELSQLTPAARRVLAVGAALFCRSGSLAVSVRELTRACGLSPGALYNHFSSRDELLFVLVRNGHDRTERRLAAAAAAAGDNPRDALANFVRAYLDVHISFPEHAQLVHREYVHLSEERKVQIVECRRRLRERMIEILRAGQRAGTFELLDGPDGAVGAAMMILDMCSRTSEWFNPAQEGAALAERYVAAAMRLVGASPS